VRQLRRVPTIASTQTAVSIHGDKAAQFLNAAHVRDIAAMANQTACETNLYVADGKKTAVLQRTTANNYTLHFANSQDAEETAVWLSDLSDGYIQFGDLYAKLPGPIIIKQTAPSTNYPISQSSDLAPTKPYHIGHHLTESTADALPAFNWEEPADPPIKRTALYATHKALGAKLVPFGGYDMPVWYTSVTEEHLAVRQTAGLFDVSHMGVLEASGDHVGEFLDQVTANEVSTLRNGRSLYSFLLMPNGDVIDDLLIYRLAEEKFLLVVNASNNDKDWAWLNAVNEGKVQIDEKRPFAKIQHPITLRDLRDPAHGPDCRVDLALQGPASKQILLAMSSDESTTQLIQKMAWAGLGQGALSGFDVIISRTGYTGERIAYELFVHPEQVVAFWQALLAAGEPLGLKPCGLAARDSTRTEAGLPLYGHEMAGELNLSPSEAGFGSYAKMWKPFFIGRDALQARINQQSQILVRFRMNDKGVRRPETGDPVMDGRGKIVGTVTSCAIDSEGYLLGLAVLPFEMTASGTPLLIYQLGGGKRPLRVPNELGLGKRLPTPDTATVLTRFPKR
jgi:glycine hydroxymethyltransferase